MDKAVDLLKLLRNERSTDGANSFGGGLRIARCVTSDPSPVTFVLEGTELALDIDVFEVPLMLYPVCVGDRFLVSHLIGRNTQRWGIVSRLNRGYTLGTMTEYNQCQVVGIGRPYLNKELLIPSGIDKGDTVILLPYKIDTSIKYAVRKGEDKLRIVKVTASDPSPTAFQFESTGEALDASIVEMPYFLYPICEDDRYITSPLIDYGSKRWGLTSRINRGYTKGKMLSATTCQVKGIGRPYASDDLILPSFVPADGAVRPLKSGDVVTLFPVEVEGKLKYMVIYCF